MNGYYKPTELRSKQRVYNFVIGMRGNGKTYSFKRVCISDFINKGEQFVWVRRYKTELDAEFIRGWSEDIQAEFPDYEITLTKKYIKINKEIAGYIIPLSTSQRAKSVSYKKVTKMVYDEFLITASGGNLTYIQDEPVLFSELYQTIDRWEDRVTCYFIGNAFSVVNPYFVYHNVEVDITQRFTLTEHICVEISQTPDIVEKAKNTRHAKMMQGTKYSEYAIETKFYNDDDSFIIKRKGNLTYMCTILYRDTSIGVWVGTKDGEQYWYCDEKIEKTCPDVIAMTTKDMIEGAKFKRSMTLDMYRLTLRQAFNESVMYYSDLNIKKLMYEFVHML